MAFIVLLYLNFRRFIFFPSFFFFLSTIQFSVSHRLADPCVFESRENFLHACCWHTEKFFSFQFFFIGIPFPLRHYFLMESHECKFWFSLRTWKPIFIWLRDNLYLRLGKFFNWMNFYIFCQKQNVCRMTFFHRFMRSFILRVYQIWKLW